MKSFPLLAVSLAANVVLFGAVLFWSVAPDATPDFSVAGAEKSPGPASSSTSFQTPATALSAANSAPTRWDQLQTADLSALVARLRAAGFPAHIVRSIIQSLVNERFGELRRLQLTQENPGSYWQSRPGYYAVDQKTRGEINRLGRERDALLKNLLGPDADDGSAALYGRRRYGELPPEKTARLDAITRDYSELKEQIFSAAKGTIIEADEEKLRTLDREQRADLEKVLTTQELFEYDLRNSAAAAQLRHEVAFVDVSEAEFRKLFPFYRELHEKFPEQWVPGGGDQASREAARKQMLEPIKAVLGAERFADFELAQNYEYQQAAKVVVRLNLPSSTTREVYAVQKDIQQRAALARGKSPVAAEREAQLTALAAEASAKIGTLLGTSGLEAYKQYGGQWLQNVAPRPAPPKK